MDVFLSEAARDDFRRLPRSMRPRVQAVILRLGHWPEVSGVNALKHAWFGHLRVRTGDWRVAFRVEAERRVVLVVRIQNRREVYDE